MDQRMQLEPSSDELLFERFRTRGDRRALSALFERYIVSISGLCARMLPRQLAEEAAQDTFIEVIRSAHVFARGAVFKCWVHGIAVNVCRRNALKERQLVAREKKVSVIASAGHSELTPLSQAVRTEVSAALDECLMEFGDDERLALTLHYGQGFSHTEVATILSRPRGTIGPWLINGIEKLRESMRRRGHAVTEASLAVLLTTVPEWFQTPLVRSAALKAAASVKPVPAILLRGGLVKTGIATLLLLVILVALRATPAEHGVGGDGRVPHGSDLGTPPAVGLNSELLKILDLKINVSYRHEYLVDIMDDVWRRTGLHSAFPAAIRRQKTFTFNAKDLTVRAVLEKIAATGEMQLEYRGDSAVFWNRAAPEAVNRLEEKARSGDQVQRVKAVHDLAQLADKRCYPILFSLLNDADTGVAAKALNELLLESAQYHIDQHHVLRYVDGTDAFVDLLMKGISPESLGTLEDTQKAVMAAMGGQLPARPVRTVDDRGLTLVRSLDGPRARQAMRSMLKKPNRHFDGVVQSLAVLRDDAVNELIEQGAKEPIGPALSNTMCLMAQRSLSRDRDRLIAFISGSDKQMRLWAMYVARYIRDERLAPVLIPLTQDSDLETQLAAVEALCRSADPRGLEAVNKLLSASDKNVRRIAANYIGLFPNADSGVVDRLVEMALQDPANSEPAPHYAANDSSHTPSYYVDAGIYSLAMIRDDYATERLLDLLNHERPEIRAGAASHVAGAERPITDPRIIDALLKLSEDPVHGKTLAPVSEFALRALRGVHGERRVAEALYPRLAAEGSGAGMNDLTYAWLQNEPDPVTQALKVEGSPLPVLMGALVSTGDPRIMDRLLQCMHDSNANTRRSAVAAVSRCLQDTPADVRPLSTLKFLLEDEDPITRLDAATALTLSTDPSVVKPVQEFAHSLAGGKLDGQYRMLTNGLALRHPEVQPVPFSSPSDAAPPTAEKTKSRTALLQSAKDEARGKIKAGTEKALARHSGLSPDLAAMMRSESVQAQWLKVIVDSAFKALPPVPSDIQYSLACKAIADLKEAGTSLEGTVFIDDYISQAIEHSGIKPGVPQTAQPGPGKKVPPINSSGVKQLP